MKTLPHVVDRSLVILRERRAASAEDGFTLIETVTSLVIFAILASAAVAMLLTATQVGRQNRSRVVAAQLAAQQIETVRGMNTQSIPNGVTALPDIATSGTTYHISQNADYINSNGTANACDSPSGSRLGYKQVSVTVTWNNMGSVAPVRSDTLKTLSIAGADPTLGSLAVAVKDNDTKALAGQVVSLTPTGGSQTTGSDGCVVFTNLPPGSNYAAGLNTIGYVDITGVQASSQGSQTVNAGQINHVLMQYDRPATLAITWLAPAGGATPFSVSPLVPVTLSNTFFPNNGKKAFLDCGDPHAVAGSCVTGTPRTIAGLFPSQYGYGIYGGTCLDAAPSSPPQPTAVDPSQTTAVMVPLAEVTAYVHTTVAQQSKPLFAIHAADTACPNGQVLTLGTTDATGHLNALLPYGRWTIATNATGASPPPASKVWPVITTTSAVPTITVDVDLQ